MDSEVDIVNAALSRIGQTALLQSTVPTIEEAAAALRKPAAEQGAIWYPQARDACLRWRAFPWPFATRREVLAIVAGETRTDWTYVYAYPADALAVRYVTLPGARNPRAEQILPHKIEARRDAGTGDIIGKLILCDQVDAELCFTGRVTNTAAFDVDWEDALIYRIAAELARALKVDGYKTVAKEMLEASEFRLREAAATALNEQRDEPEPTGSFLASRS